MVRESGLSLQRVQLRGRAVVRKNREDREQEAIGRIARDERARQRCKRARRADEQDEAGRYVAVCAVQEGAEDAARYRLHDRESGNDLNGKDAGARGLRRVEQQRSEDETAADAQEAREERRDEARDRGDELSAHYASPCALLYIGSVRARMLAVVLAILASSCSSPDRKSTRLNSSH